MNQDDFQLVIDYVKNDDVLEEGEKTRFLTGIGSLMRGESLEATLADELTIFLDDVFEKMENDAIAREDTETINMLSDIREKRNEIYQKAISGNDQGQGAKTE
ncbi:MAG: hypothetical protein ABID04_00615 [Patescibacteria group bacterium]